jgi:hypothetical protein
MSRVYVYAFCGSAIAPFTLDRRRIRSVEHAGIHIAIDRAAAHDVTETSLRRQHAIVEAIAARADAVLPARAGSSIDEEELRSRVERGQATLNAALDLVRGRKQMTLRLAGAQAAPSATGAAPSGTAYLEARRMAGIPSPELIAVVRALVSDLVHGERIQPARNGLPAAMFHLIGQRDAQLYRRRIEEAPALAGARPLVTGPFPPFAFTPELAG